MSSNTVRQILETRLITEWGSTTPIKWDNTLITHDAPYISCDLSNTFSENKGMGCQRMHYLFIIRVYIPFGEGAADNMKFADCLISAFQGYSSEGLVVYGTQDERVGQIEELYRRDVIISAYYDKYF